METNQLDEKEVFYQNLKKFPPFYTLQDHQETRQKQLVYWAEITHLHFKKHRIIESSLSELNSETCQLFSDNSTGIQKKLAKDEIFCILNEMSKLGTIEWRGDQKENFRVNFTSQFELADAIYAWAKEQKLIGYTETLKGISQGEQTESHLKFYELPEDQILRACQVLEQTGRADVFEFEGMYSVKFK